MRKLTVLPTCSLVSLGLALSRMCVRGAAGRSGVDINNNMMTCHYESLWAFAWAQSDGFE
jgi:hypothetical protein